MSEVKPSDSPWTDSSKAGAAVSIQKKVTLSEPALPVMAHFLFFTILTMDGYYHHCIQWPQR